MPVRRDPVRLGFDDERRKAEAEAETHLLEVFLPVLRLFSLRFRQFILHDATDQKQLSKVYEKRKVREPRTGTWSSVIKISCSSTVSVRDELRPTSSSISSYGNRM